MWKSMSNGFLSQEEINSLLNGELENNDINDNIPKLKDCDFKNIRYLFSIGKKSYFIRSLSIPS